MGPSSKFNYNQGSMQQASSLSISQVQYAKAISQR